MKKNHFTTENFTLLQKILLHEKYFFLHNCADLNSFYHSKINNLFMLIYINVLEYELNTKETSSSDSKIILL